MKNHVTDQRHLVDLAKAFSDWEKHLRGWDIFDYAVVLEPVFNQIKITKQRITPIRDDARVRGGIGGFFSRNQNTHRLPNQSTLEANVARESIPTPEAFYRKEELVEFQLLLPKELEITPATMNQFLLSLSGLKTPVSFELLADSQEIILQMACDSSFGDHLKNQLGTFFPSVLITKKQNALASYFGNQTQPIVVDFGLKNKFLLPLQTFSKFNPDPLTGLVSSLGNLRQNEKVLFQVLFQKLKFSWAEEVNRIFSHHGLKTYFGEHNPSLILSLKEKLSDPLLACVIRIAAGGREKEQSWQTLRKIGGNLAPFLTPNGNELIALENRGLSDNNHFLSLLSRTSYRSGMLLNISELTSIVHVPSDSVKVKNLKRDEKLTKAVPEATTGGSLNLGENHHAGKITQVALSTKQRVKHMHLVGSSGSGKSTNLIFQMDQDLNLGNGFICLDPHGDLIDSVLERVPAHRLKDVILFDPADENFPIGFNILSAHSELEKTLLASDLVAIFRRFSTSWGDQMNSVLANAVLAFLESDRGGNLLDLKRFLIEKSFRTEFLKTVKDEEIIYYWQKEFPDLRGKPYAPLLTRLDTFLRSKLVRYIVAQKENKLDFRRIMDEKKILLVRLSVGAIGEENAYLLGSLIVTKLHQATLSRQDVSEESREPFFCYLDEAHHFISPSMNQILTGVRKYKLGLILAHQNLQQFKSGDADVLESVLSNCYTRICFRLDDRDAERMANGFSFFTADHLKNLGVGEAIARFEQSRYDCNLKTFLLPEVEPDLANQRKQAVIENSRAKHAKPKTEVETELSIRTDVSPTETPVREKESKNHVETSKSRQEETPVEANKQHRYLQSIIKRIGERKGFISTIEKQVFGGVGKVDVALEKDDLKIACEVANTNSVDYEVQNIQKCLSAGFQKVVVISESTRHLSNIKKNISAFLVEHQMERVHFLEPDSFHLFLENLLSSEPKDNEPEVRIRGYKVDASFKEPSDAENDAKEKVIAKVISEAIKRSEK